MIKICEYCHKEFNTYNKNQRFCSHNCYLDSVKLSIITVTCKYCNKTFMTKEKFRKFCSPKCAALWRSKYNPESFKNNLTAEQKIQQGLRLKNKWKDEEFRSNVINRMKNNNPVKDENVKLKIKQSISNSGKKGFTKNYAKNRGGNGKISPTEKLIFDFMISLGFEYNKAINMTELRKKEPDKKFANHYKPDFVNEIKAICVEIDGKSHNSDKQKELDLKKEYALNFYNYKVYRFTNEYVQNNLDEFKNEVVNLLGYKVVEVKDVSKNSDKEFMYDIEVQDNHNYFANNLLVHNCKDITSQQTVGIMSLDKRISKLLMTGTLLVNNPHDLFCPMSICGLISYNKYVFDSKFIVKDAYGNEIGYQNMDELHNILYKSSLRRTKELLDLPPKIYKQEWLELNKDEQNVFDQIIGKAAFKLDKIEEPNEMVAIITRMRQATVASELLTSKKITSTKFERLNDILEEAQLNNQKVLVFCPFTKALELGLEYCKKYHPKIVKGGMGAGIQKVVDEHENTEGFSILFAQEATLGVGYTLKNTSIVIFLSPPWSRATYDQCVDRTHRYRTEKYSSSY